MSMFILLFYFSAVSKFETMLGCHFEVCCKIWVFQQNNWESLKVFTSCLCWHSLMKFWKKYKHSHTCMYKQRMRETFSQLVDRSSISPLLLPTANVSTGSHSQRLGTRSSAAVRDVSHPVMMSVVQLWQSDNTSGDSEEERAGLWAERRDSDTVRLGESIIAFGLLYGLVCVCLGMCLSAEGLCFVDG